MNARANGKWYTGKYLYIIIIAFFLFFCYIAISVGSTNAIIPMICGINGWDESLVLVGITVAGYVGAFATLYFGKLIEKKGVKFVSGLCIIIAGVLFGFWGIIQSIAVFIINIIVLTAMAYGFQMASCPVLISNWFPRKKGIVLGWATMGICAVDLTWSQFMPGLIAKNGTMIVFMGVGICYIIIGILILTTVHNFPEEEGKYPDNIYEGSVEVREMSKKLNEYKTPWTFSKCLKNKQCWQIVFGWGVLNAIIVCFVQRLVPRILTLGYDQPYALTVLACTAASAIVGSWVFGFIDQKIGTKKASIIFCIWEIIMFILAFFMPLGTGFVWIASCGIMGGSGGVYNLLLSMNIQIFGRWDFVGTNRFVAFWEAIIVSSTFAINAIFSVSPAGFIGLYTFCLVAAIISFIVVIKTKPNLIGKKDEMTNTIETA